MSDTEKTVEPAPIPTYPEDAAPSVKPRFMVVGSTFYAQTEQGEVRLPITFKTKLIRALPEDLETSLSQLWWLLENEPDESLRKKYAAELGKLDELDIDDAREVASELFRAKFERQQARLGESRRSSSS